MNPSPASTIFFALVAVFVGGGLLWAASAGARLAVDHTPLKASLTAATEDALNAISVTESVASSSASSTLPTTAIKSDANSLTILMGGDMMFDRNVRALGEQYGYNSLLSSLTPLFSQADIVVANLEGPITTNASKTLLPNNTTAKDLTFTFDPAAAPAIAAAGVDIVSLANNHTDNFGKEGFAETEKYLDAAGVKHFGDPWNQGHTEVTECPKGICVAFVGYHAFMPGFETMVADVRRLAAANYFVIVMPHWGIEYSATDTPDMQAKARELVAAGAKAVIGAHPHVIGQHEWIGGVPVYYSLGNLLFDQYFSPATMKGNIVELHLVRGDNGVSLESLHVYDTSTASLKDVTYTEEPLSSP